MAMRSTWWRKYERALGATYRTEHTIKIIIVLPSTVVGHYVSHNLYACYRSQRVHCGAPTGVGDRVRVRAPEARLGYRMHGAARVGFHRIYMCGY